MSRFIYSEAGTLKAGLPLDLTRRIFFDYRDELSNAGVLVDRLGGDIPLVEISALMKENLDELVETIVLAAAEKDPQADPKAMASGFVIESSNDKHKGFVLAAALWCRPRLVFQSLTLLTTAFALPQASGDRCCEGRDAQSRRFSCCGRGHWQGQGSHGCGWLQYVFCGCVLAVICDARFGSVSASTALCAYRGKDGWPVRGCGNYGLARDAPCWSCLYCEEE